MDTPAFLLWSIEYECRVRGLQDGSDPEPTERQLRAAREFSQARGEGRIFEGLALDPPLGFRVAETLALYGGLAAIESACNDCPCNALRAADPPVVAGCYGIVPLPMDPAAFYSAVDRAIDALALASDDEYHQRSSGFIPEARASRESVHLGEKLGGSRTSPSPRWYGLWQHSPLQADELSVSLRILNAAAMEDDACREAIDELKLGLQAAFSALRPLHVRLYPPGRVEGPWWRLVPHCPQCTAPFSATASQTCAVCGYIGHPAPDKKRHARGLRPYFPLDRLLGADQAADVLARFALHRGSSLGLA